MLTARLASFAMGCAAAMVATAGAGIGAGQQTIVLWDELRTAFYEHAPSHMAAGMGSAVRSYCKAKVKGPSAGVDSAASQPGWLCAASRHRYLRNVYLNGARGNHGLVCDDTGLFNFRYIGVDLAKEQVTAHACVFVDFDGSAFQVVPSSGPNDGDT